LRGSGGDLTIRDKKPQRYKQEKEREMLRRVLRGIENEETERGKRGERGRESCRPFPLV
jgi:hypothetical protein